MKRLISNMSRAIERFFFREDDRGDFLVFFRAAVGLVLLLHFLSVIRDFERLFGADCIVPQDIITVFHPDWLLTYPKLAAWLTGAGASEAGVALCVKILFPLLCLMLIGGLFSRWAALLLLPLHIALIKGASFFIYGVDFFLAMSLFYLILLPADRYGSLRNTLWGPPKNPPAYMPLKRAFQLHISIAYFFSGFDKLLGFNWHNGESIWKAINLPYANRDFFFDFSWLADHPWMLISAGWATILIEMLYPIFIWVPATRRLWLTLTIGLHLGIALILNLYFFSAIMIVWNLSNFYFETRRTGEVPKERLSKTVSQVSLT